MQVVSVKSNMLILKASSIGSEGILSVSSSETFDLIKRQRASKVIYKDMDSQLHHLCCLRINQAVPKCFAGENNSISLCYQIQNRRVYDGRGVTIINSEADLGLLFKYTLFGWSN